jgi:DNA-3-methyladenine glycosylase II
MFKDPILKKLVKKYPAPKFEDKSEFLYEGLIESIISQQLSVKAADTIFVRFLKLFKSKSFPKPKDVLKMKDDTLRTAGISYQKISYIKSVAHAFETKQIDHKKIIKLSDEEVIAELTKIKGVGRWTAEMKLIFTLNRSDVFSIGDLGLRNAIIKLYGISDKKEMLKLSETWKPFRSYACWYLWRSLENE